MKDKGGKPANPLDPMDYGISKPNYGPIAKPTDGSYGAYSAPVAGTGSPYDGKPADGGYGAKGGQMSAPSTGSTAPTGGAPSVGSTVPSGGAPSVGTYNPNGAPSTGTTFPAGGAPSAPGSGPVTYAPSAPTTPGPGYTPDTLPGGPYVPVGPGDTSPVTPVVPAETRPTGPPIVYTPWTPDGGSNIAPPNTTPDSRPTNPQPPRTGGPDVFDAPQPVLGPPPNPAAQGNPAFATVGSDPNAHTRDDWLAAMMRNAGMAMEGNTAARDQNLQIAALLRGPVAPATPLGPPAQFVPGGPAAPNTIPLSQGPRGGVA